MGTSNFSTLDAKQIYAVLMSYEAEDDDGNEVWYTPDQWEYEDLRDELIQTLSEEFKNFDKDKPGKLREGAELGEIRRYRHFGDDITIGYRIIPVILSGYYDGANLDYKLIIEEGRYEYDDIDEIDDDYEYAGNRGLYKIHMRQAKKWLLTEMEKDIEKIENLYKSWSTPLVATARFSNGETFYSKA